MRKPRLEIEGLYQIITRGNNRRAIFGADEDYRKFLALVASQKVRLPFYLYAYCLMPNHVHRLVERRDRRVYYVRLPRVTHCCRKLTMREGIVHSVHPDL